MSYNRNIKVFVIAITCLCACTNPPVSTNPEFDHAVTDTAAFHSAMDSLLDAEHTRRIERLVVHCTASRGNLDSTALMRIFKERWGQNARPGYHGGVFAAGDITILQELDGDEIISAPELVWGASGYNSSSIHIFYDGGVDARLQPKDTRTRAQKTGLRFIIDMYRCRYPWIEVVGHHNLNPNKACPSFDAFSEYSHSLIETDALYDNKSNAGDSTH